MVMGLALLILSIFFIKYPMKNEFGLTETKFFHFHGIFKNGGWGGGGVQA